VQNPIMFSVGRGGKNDPQDVAIVQKLLNYVGQWQDIPEEPLDVDGKVGPKTLGAIIEFQKNFCKVVDGRVDPNKQTITMLNAMAEPLPRFNNGVSYFLVPDRPPTGDA
jgi:peptidoglycan hydrolase-like protein with peptidoglycan-binding domain